MFPPLMGGETGKIFALSTPTPTLPCRGEGDFPKLWRVKIYDKE